MSRTLEAPVVPVATAAACVPTRHDQVTRKRLHRILDDSHGKPVVIVAPTGFGKTSLAIQYAKARTHVIWLDGALCSCAAEEVNRAVLTRLFVLMRTARIGDGDVDHRLDDLFSVRGLELLSKTTVVIDDFGAHPDTQTALGTVISALSPLLSGGLRLVVTTDGAPELGARPELLVTLLNSEQLLVREDESDEWECIGERLEGDSGRVDVSRAAFGIPGLVSTMLRAGHGSREVEDFVLRVVVDWKDRVDSPQQHDLAMMLLLMHSGAFSDLVEMGFPGWETEIPQIVSDLQVLGIDLAHSAFRTARLPIADILGVFSDSSLISDVQSLERLAETMASSGHVVRATELYAVIGQPFKLAEWLKRWGETLITRGKLFAVESALNRIPSSVQVGDPGLLLLKARVEWLKGGLASSASLLEAAACCDPSSSTALDAETFRLLAAAMGGDEQQFDECGDLVFDEPYDFADAEDTGLLRYVQLAYMALLSGNPRPAIGIVEWASSWECGPLREYHWRILTTIVAMDRIALGGRYSYRILSTFLDLAERDTTTYNIALAHMGFCRVMALECDAAVEGASRAMSFMRGSGMSSLADLAGFTIGLCSAVEGDMSAVVQMRTAVDAALCRGERRRANQMRVYQVMALRALGHGREALRCAQDALAFFSVRSCREMHLAAVIELAASHLYVGDESSARKLLAQRPQIERVPDHLKRRLVIVQRMLDGVSDIVPEEEATSHAAGEAGLDAQAWVDRMYSTAFPAACRPHSSTLEVVAVKSGGVAPSISTFAPIDMDQTPACVIDVPEGALRVRMFGGFEVECAGDLLEDDQWCKRKSRSLFAALVLCRGKDISRDVLFERFWPHMDYDRARDNFYVTWSNMKRTLRRFGEADVFVKSRSGICRVDSSRVISDIDEFEVIMARVVLMDEQTQQREILQMYRRMEHIYRGELLGGNLYEDWFARNRTMYHDAFIESMVRASDLALSVGEVPLSLWFARKALDADASREESYRCLIRAQLVSNQRSSALETFHRCRTYMSEELGLDPSAETMELYNELIMMDESTVYRASYLS